MDGVDRPTRGAPDAGWAGNFGDNGNGTALTFVRAGQGTGVLRILPPPSQHLSRVI